MDDAASIKSAPGGQNQTDVNSERLELIKTRIHRYENENEITKKNILSLKREWNTLIPISRLPAEMLTRVFMLLADNKKPYSWEKKPWWDWLIITKVCGHWRNVAIQCPLLWVNIKYFRGEEKVKTFLDRSGRTELVVALGGEEKNTALYSGVVDLIRFDMDRVRDFTASVGRDRVNWEELQTLLGAPESLPRLKKLYLHVNSSVSIHTRSIPLDSLAANMPVVDLQKLSLNGVHLPWSHLMIHGLSKLSLEDIDIPNQPTLSDLLNFLECCPNLRKLKMENAGPSESNDLPHNPRLIELPELEYITLQPVDYNDCIKLFDCLVISRDVSWSIVCLDYPFDDPAPFIPKLLNRTTSCNNLSISFCNDWLIFESDEGETDEISTPRTVLQLHWDPIPDIDLEYSVHKIFEATGVIFRQTPFWSDVNRICFKILGLTDVEKMAAMKETGWCLLLDIMTTIGDLNVSFPEKHKVTLVEGLIAALSQNINSSDPVIKCPKLKKLTLTNAKLSTKKDRTVYRTFIEYLQHRCRLGKRLSYLWLSGCYGIDQKDMDEIERLNLTDELFYGF